MGLALLAPGSRTLAVNATTPLPDRNNGEAREFQLNMDGQQVSAGRNRRSAAVSQDSISESRLSNRFDATQGRSSGVRSTPSPNRAATGFRVLPRNFRNDGSTPRTHAAPGRADQQSAVQHDVGGPLVKDKLHYFVNYEYEREPRTSIWNTPYPEFNVDLDGANNKKLGGVRLDYQLSTQTRLMGKVSAGRLFEPFG